MGSSSGNSIPVWKITTPITQKDFLGRLVVYEGTEESWVDKVTGILVYQTKSIKYLPDPAVTYFLETISLSTNAPIGGSLDGTEFVYSEEK